MRECGNGKYTAFCRQCQNEIKYDVLIHFMHITHLASSFLPLACYLVTFCYILRIFVQMSSIFLFYLYIFCLIFFCLFFFLITYVLFLYIFMHFYVYFRFYMHKNNIFKSFFILLLHKYKKWCIVSCELNTKENF